MPYTETQLTKLIEEVEKEFTMHLAKAEGEEFPTLSKAEEAPKDKPKPKEEGESEKPEAKPEGAPAEGAPEAKPEGEVAPAEAAPQPGANPQEAMQPAAQGHDYDEQDMEHMKKMYMSMSEPELKAHHDCIAQLMKCGGGAPMMGKSEAKSEIENENPVLNSKPHDKGSDMFPDKKDGGIEAAPPHNTPGAKSPASNANGAKINKSEHDRRNGGEIDAQALKNTPGAKSPASKADGVQMNKSENGENDLLKSEHETLLAKHEDLQKRFDLVATFLTALVDKKVAPTGKAITDLSALAKNEGETEDKVLSKDEIHQVLCKKSSEPTLKKSDRDAINTYYADGRVDIKGISHLLK